MGVERICIAVERVTSRSSRGCGRVSVVILVFISGSDGVGVAGNTLVLDLSFLLTTYDSVPRGVGNGGRPSVRGDFITIRGRPKLCINRRTHFNKGIVGIVGNGASALLRVTMLPLSDCTGPSVRTGCRNQLLTERDNFLSPIGCHGRFIAVLNAVRNRRPNFVGGIPCGFLRIGVRNVRI